MKFDIVLIRWTLSCDLFCLSYSLPSSNRYKRQVHVKYGKREKFPDVGIIVVYELIWNGSGPNVLRLEVYFSPTRLRLTGGTNSFFFLRC